MNFDTRSFYLNAELLALIYDKSVAQELHEQFELDSKQCIEMTSKKIIEYSKYKRLIRHFARLGGVVL